MDFQPLVSIIIPVYNGSNFLRYAIESALMQTYKNIEVIVVNDGSDDLGDTENIALSYKNEIRYIRKENGGVASALNLGIKSMKGDYFSWLSHDDMYAVTKIEHQIQTLQEMQDKTMIIAAGYKVIDVNGKELFDVDCYKEFGKDILERPLCALFRMALNGCSLLIHKSHFMRAGMFDESLPTTQDYECFFRLMKGQKIVYAPYIDVLTRAHEEQGSRKHLDSHLKECNALWIHLVDNLKNEDFELMGETESSFYDWIREYFKKRTLYKEATLYFDSLYKLSSNITPKEQFYMDTFHLSIESVYQNRLCDIVDKNRKTKIAFMIETVNELGGLSRVVLQIASGLCMFYDVTLVIYEKPTGRGYNYSDQIHILQLEYQNFGLDTVRLLKSLGVACVIIPFNCYKPYLSLYELFKCYHIITIAWNHEHYFLPYYQKDLNSCVLERKHALQTADLVFWLNQRSNDIYRLFANNSIVMPNPNPYSKLPQDCNSFSHNIISVGRFDDDKKGLGELLQAFSIVQERCEDAELFVVGSYDLDMMTLWMDKNISYRDLIKQLRIDENRIHFLGMIKDVETYYRMGCVHVLPSKYEGFGLVILESFSFGIPNVVFANSGMDDLVIDDFNGYLIHQNDISHMADCVLRIIKNENLYHRLSENAKSFVLQYREEKILQKWKTVIDNILDGNGIINKNIKEWNSDECRTLINEYDELFVLNSRTMKNEFNNSNKYLLIDLYNNGLVVLKSFLDKVGILSLIRKTSLKIFGRR